MNKKEQQAQRAKQEDVVLNKVLWWIVGAVVVFRVMQAAGGKLRLKGNWVEVLPKSANYALLYVTCGVVAAVVIAALLLGGLAVLYGVLVAWLLILAVYYTVRLM